MAMMAGMKEMGKGFNVFVGIVFFFQVLMNIGTIFQVVWWADNDEENPAFIFAIVCCAYLNLTTGIASRYFWKKTPKNLGLFLPVFFGVWVFSLIDLIGYGNETWERSYFMGHEEKKWIVTWNLVNMVASSYNFSIFSNVSGMM